MLTLVQDSLILRIQCVTARRMAIPIAITANALAIGVRLARRRCHSVLVLAIKTALHVFIIRAVVIVGIVVCIRIVI